MNSTWHFLIMIVASLLIFFLIVRLLLSKTEYLKKIRLISVLGFTLVVLGMTFGKYGATYGLPWWIYYPVPMLITVLLPPVFLKLNTRKTIVYLALSFFSAPLIHFIFSFFVGWTEYMPFWKIPFVGDLFNA